MAGSGAAQLPLVLQLLSLVPAQGMGTGKSGSLGSAGQDPVLAQTSLREGAGTEVASPDPCLGWPASVLLWVEELLGGKALGG